MITNGVSWDQETPFFNFTPRTPPLLKQLRQEKID